MARTAPTAAVNTEVAAAPAPETTGTGGTRPVGGTPARHLPGRTRRRSPWAALVVVLAVVVGVVAACGSDSDSPGGITVSDARIPEPANPEVAAAYLTVTNGSSTDDVLESVTTSAGGDAELHRTTVTDGTSTMEAAGPVTVAAGDTLTLEPGGFHVMIMGPSEPLQTGDRVEVTLRFREAGEVSVEVPVVDPAEVFTGGSGGEDMSDHSDH